MADRYQDRPFPAHDDYGRGADTRGQGDSDPLAELARLIGQTDPFAMGRANPKAQPRDEQRQQPQHQSQQYEPESDGEPEVELPAGPPPWMRRANANPPPQADQQYDDEPEYQPSPVHPLQRYAAQHAGQESRYSPPQYPEREPEPEQYQEEQEPQYAEDAQPDPARYDDALYGQLEASQDYQREP